MLKNLEKMQLTDKAIINTILAKYDLSIEMISITSQEQVIEPLSERWLTYEQAMAYTKLSRATIQKAKADGLIKYRKLKDSARCSRVTFEKKSIDDWLDNR